jgi:hypothetical protein
LVIEPLEEGDKADLLLERELLHMTQEERAVCRVTGQRSQGSQRRTLLEKLDRGTGNEWAAGCRAKIVKSAGSERLASTAFALDRGNAKMTSRAAHL